MARKYSERIENMSDEDRKAFDDRIREYEKNNGWQKAMSKFKTSPIQLRAIKAGKDPMRAKPKKKPKAEAKPKKAAKKRGKKGSKKVAKAVKAAGKKKAKRGKKATKKSGRKANGVTKKVNAQGALIIEGQIEAQQFVAMILAHSEKLMKIATSA